MNQEKQRRLEVVEELLWGPPNGKGSERGWNPAGGYLGRLQARALKKTLAFVVQLLQVEMTDIQFQYTQWGEPGPRPALNYLQGADAAILHLRTLSLMPQFKAVKRSVEVAEDDSVDGNASGAPSPLASPRKTPRNTPRNAEEPTWWAALGSLPHLLWSNVVITSPSSTKLSVNGVSLVLRTYPMLWQGYHAARTAAEQPPPGPFNFTAGKVESISSKRRRRGVIAERLSRPEEVQNIVGTASAVGTSSMNAQSPTKPKSSATAAGSSKSSSTPRSSASIAPRSDDDWVDYATTLSNTPSEDHIIFRQWEFSVMLCLLPPGYETMETSSLVPSAHVLASALASQLPHEKAKAGGNINAGDLAQVHTLDMADRSPTWHLSKGRPSLTAFGSAQGVTTEYNSTDLRGLQHFDSGISGGFEDADQELADDLSPIASARRDDTEEGKSGEFLNAGSSLYMMEQVSDDEYGSPATSPRASSKSSSGSVSPDRRSFKFEPLLPAVRTKSAASGMLDGGGPNGGIGGQYNNINNNGGGHGGSGGVSTPPANGKHVIPSPFDASTGSPASSTAQKAGLEVPPAATSAPQAAAGAGAGGAKEVPAASGQKRESAAKSAFTVDVAVTLKALIFELDSASVAVVNRLVDRQTDFSHFGHYWAVRPQVAVAGNEALWWQHGGRALAASTRGIARREVPLSKLEARRAARQEYQQLYAGLHIGHRHFTEPGRRWWQMRKVRAADEADKWRLMEFESELSLEELSHFRLGVAAVHNDKLAHSEKLLHLVANKVDSVVYTRRFDMDQSIPILLLHHDRKPMFGPGSASADGKATTTRFGLRLSIACPKLAIALDMRPTARSSSPEDAKYLVLAMRKVGAELDVDGGITLQIDSVDCGHSAAPTGALKPHVLACPSDVCERVCHAAEFTRYAMTGDVVSSSSVPGHYQSDTCAVVRIRPRYGVGGTLVDDDDTNIPDSQPVTYDGTAGTASGTAGSSINDQKWVPAGFDVDVRIAAIGVVYNDQATAALLDVISASDACRSKPWVWNIPSESHSKTAAGGGNPAGKAGSVGGNSDRSSVSMEPQWPPSLPLSPISVTEMVETAFATAHEPILGRLVLPSTSFVLNCPGFALQLPYKHKNSASLFKATGRRRAMRNLPGPGEEEGGGESIPAGGLDVGDLTPNTPGAGTSTSANGGAGAGNAPRPSSTLGENQESESDTTADALTYMFTVTLQNILINVDGEDFEMALTGGTARRIQGCGYLDVFSYLSRSSRRALARHIMPSKVIFDPTQRRFTEEVAGIEALELELREIELCAMAKVWSYPEDMPSILKARKEQSGYSKHPVSSDGVEVGGEGSRRNPSTGLDAATGLAKIMPELLKSPNQYPIPLLPYLKVGGTHGNLVQRLTAAPDDPGGAVLTAAAKVLGVQAWVSPMHVWHLVSLESTIRGILRYLVGSSIAETVAERKAEAAAAVSMPDRPVPRPRRHLLFSLEVDQVSLLWLIGTWTSKGFGTVPGDPTHYSRAWGITVKRGDPAYLWAQWLAPVYGVSLARINTALVYRPDGTIVAGASVDGIIVRDLQLPDGAKHAYVLRPLPARARRLNTWVQNIRRVLLGVVSVSRPRVKWNTAYFRIILRRRTSLDYTNRLLHDPEMDGVRPLKALSVIGPQFAVSYRSTPPAARVGHVGQYRPQEEVRIEVGQMLAYVRIKQQASMTAFAQQMTQIADMITPPSGGAANTPSSSSAGTQRPGPSLQTGLRIDIVVVGIDVLFRVESRDLMALKLQNGVITVDRKAVTKNSGPKDIRLHMSASIQDIMIQDMRVSIWFF